MMPREQYLNLLSDLESRDILIDKAWTLLSNAYDGDWTKAPWEWRTAVERWAVDAGYREP